MTDDEKELRKGLVTFHSRTSTITAMDAISKPSPGGVLVVEPHQISTALNGKTFTPFPWLKKSDRSVESDSLQPTTLVP